MFMKIGVLKNLANFTRRRLGWSLFLIKFFYRLPPVAASIYVAFHECFFFSFSFAALPLLPYCTATFFVWRTLSSLCHYYYMINIIIVQSFIRITANVTTCCTAISMIVTRISALMQFILKQKTKKPVNKVQRKIIFSFRHVISLICQECLISLNSFLTLTKQTEVYINWTLKLTWSQLANVAITIDIAR